MPHPHVQQRYEKGPIILTSNKTFSEWGQVFGDEVLATAILDRLLHHCDVISINGPSYRLGRKRQIVVDTKGMPVMIMVTPADMTDRDAARELLDWANPTEVELVMLTPS